MIHIFPSYSLIKYNREEFMISYKNFGLVETRTRVYSNGESRKSYSENGNEITALRIISTFFNLLDWKILRIVGVVHS